MDKGIQALVGEYYLANAFFLKRGYIFMKEYYCRKIENGLSIDGDLSKEQWRAAEAMLLSDTVTGGAPGLATEVRLLWDDHYLYAAFRCQDDAVFATMTAFNDRLYEEDVVELFLDDNCDRTTYIELEVNPLNALLHYSIHNDPRGRRLAYARIENTTRSVVVREDAAGSYSVEMAIPFDEFATSAHIPPEPGDCWYFNAYRIDRHKGESVEYSAWSPTGAPDFHRPEKFGRLVFVRDR
jgi:hypothetical protein